MDRHAFANDCLSIVMLVFWRYYFYKKRLLKLSQPRLDVHTFGVVKNPCSQWVTSLFKICVKGTRFQYPFLNVTDSTVNQCLGRARYIDIFVLKPTFTLRINQK